MAQPLRPKSLATRVKTNTRNIRQEQRKPNLPGPYIYVCNGDPEDLDPPVATWQSPPWLNSFTWSGTSYFGFRHGLDGSTEFVGALDLTAGAVTGDVAFKLPVPFRNVFDPRIFPIDLGAGAWTLGILRMVTVIGVSFGDVIIEWPIQADPI
jgi:hypothetical protein